MNIAIVGASGAVGEEMIKCLEERNFPVSNLKLLASKRSAGKKLKFREQEVEIEELNENSFKGIDIALFSAGAGISKAFAPFAKKENAVVIDNSSAFRMDDDVPLVVPEINPKAIKSHKGIIANPNCSTIITLMAIAPLHKKWHLKKIIASTYQAVSGSGASAIIELQQQEKILNSRQKVKKITTKVYPKQIANNVLPQVDIFLENDYTKEEMKMLYEGRKILACKKMKASVTCVRVPVYRAHSIAITAQFKEKPIVKKAIKQINKFDGVQVFGERENYPTPLEISQKDDCYVGRIRKDLALKNALSLWVVGDQIKKGAALNAVQIAEKLISNK